MEKGASGGWEARRHRQRERDLRVEVALFLAPPEPADDEAQVARVAVYREDRAGEGAVLRAGEEVAHHTHEQDGRTARMADSRTHAQDCVFMLAG